MPNAKLSPSTENEPKVIENRESQIRELSEEMSAYYLSYAKTLKNHGQSSTPKVPSVVDHAFSKKSAYPWLQTIRETDTNKVFYDGLVTLVQNITDKCIQEKIPQEQLQQRLTREVQEFISAYCDVLEKKGFLIPVEGNNDQTVGTIGHERRISTFKKALFDTQTTVNQLSESLDQIHKKIQDSLKNELSFSGELDFLKRQIIQDVGNVANEIAFIKRQNDTIPSTVDQYDQAHLETLNTKLSELENKLVEINTEIGGKLLEHLRKIDKRLLIIEHVDSNLSQMDQLKEFSSEYGLLVKTQEIIFDRNFRPPNEEVYKLFERVKSSITDKGIHMISERLVETEEILSQILDGTVIQVGKVPYHPEHVLDAIRQMFQQNFIPNTAVLQKFIRVKKLFEECKLLVEFTY